MPKLTAEQRTRLDNLLGQYDAARVALANAMEDIAAEWGDSLDEQHKRLELLKGYAATVEGAEIKPNLWYLSQ